MTIAEISKMSVRERLQTMEALWDSLTHESTEIKSPTWHADVLSKRKEKIESGHANFISLKELSQKVINEDQSHSNIIRCGNRFRRW